jgi:glycosyltransferase involved in cell wall biosynthesis
MPAEAIVRVQILLPSDLVSEKIGGIQSFVRDFIKFAPDDFEIEVVGVTADPAERPVGRWRAMSVDGRPMRYFSVAHLANVHRRSWIPLALRYTAGLLRWRRHIPTRGRILQFHRAGVPLAFIDRSGPAIQVVHLNVADIYAEAGESRWRLVPGLYHRVENFTIGRMSRIFVVNESGVRFYRERYPAMAERITFMPTWFDDTLFRVPHEAEKSSARAEVEATIRLVGEDERLILFVGRLERQKDPDLLIDAFAAAVAGGLRAHLLIVGDGDMRQAAQSRAAASGQADRIHLLGWRSREDVARLMKGSDGLLLTSRFEGMPITVLEAMATGLPVASTAVGEVPRLIQNGVSGWLAAERTPAAIAVALAKVVGGDREELGRGASRAAASYAARAVLGAFYEAHRDVLAAGSDARAT